jgi:hypothetical protein
MTKFRKSDWIDLRGKVDRNDQFMTGCSIRKIRQTPRNVPRWTLDNAEVQKVLLRVFPKLHSCGSSELKRLVG